MLFSSRLTLLAARRLSSFQTRNMSVFSTSRLVGKTVLITGASSGIGAATAQLFARCGSNVVLVARRQHLLEAVAKKCEEEHIKSGHRSGQVVGVTADMTDRRAVEGLLGEIGDLEVDILVNNAGLVKGREQVGEITDEDIDVMFETNVLGLIRLTQVVVRELKRRNTGMIINLGSVAGVEPYAGGSIYCATKHAVNAFSGSLMRELVSTNVRVAEILPGMVETEFSVVRWRGDHDRADNEYKGITPLTGHDIAEQIVWVASRPEHVQVSEVHIFPTQQASATVNWRRP